MSYEDEVASYSEHGYVLVKGLLSKEEAAFYRSESHALIQRVNRDVDPTWGSAKELATATNTAEARPAGDIATDADDTAAATALRHCHDAQFYSAAFSRLIVDQRFTDVAAALMDARDVQLHHTKIFVKPPEKGSPFPMHQDYPYFPHAKHSVGAAIFHFDDAPADRGCVRVVPGSHRRGPLQHEPQGGWHLPFDTWGLDGAVPCTAEAGDVLFFNYFTVHGSGINQSSQPRTTLLVQFRQASDVPTKDVHTQSLGQGMMLRGVRPIDSTCELQ